MVSSVSSVFGRVIFTMLPRRKDSQTQFRHEPTTNNNNNNNVPTEHVLYARAMDDVGNWGPVTAVGWKVILVEDAGYDDDDDSFGSSNNDNNNNVPRERTPSQSPTVGRESIHTPPLRPAFVWPSSSPTPETSSSFREAGSKSTPLPLPGAETTAALSSSSSSSLFSRDAFYGGRWALWLSAGTTAVALFPGITAVAAW
mmetsp:Transcript_5486/g.11601  ORF Transcript_5486/g.11601 Transcript_5486/m.11601 type:complete len:199 (-) Transcript_5486:225-821(-)